MIASCTKEGPEGPSGTPGHDGTNGANGTDGTDGNANVKSLIYDVNSLSNGSNYKYKIIPASIITSTIYQTGAVIVYVFTYAGWEALPYTTFPYGGNSYTQSWMCYHRVGEIELRIYDSDLTLPVVSIPFSLKIVCVAAGREAYPNVNFNNYEEVKKAFNLRD